MILGFGMAFLETLNNKKWIVMREDVDEWT